MLRFSEEALILVIADFYSREPRYGAARDEAERFREERDERHEHEKASGERRKERAQRRAEQGVEREGGEDYHEERSLSELRLQGHYSRIPHVERARKPGSVLDCHLSEPPTRLSQEHDSLRLSGVAYILHPTS